jgi:hypothetical protein
MKICPPIKWLYSKFYRLLLAVKKHWKKVTVSGAFLLVIGVVGFVADILGIRSYITETDNQAQIISAVEANAEDVTTNVTTKITESEESLKEEINKAGKISCKDLDGGDWVINDTMVVENQYLFLKDGQKMGSVRLFGDFADTFIMKFVFIPNVIEGINASFSIKDEDNNELMLSMGDDVSEQDGDMNFDFYKASFKNAAGEVYEITGPGNTEINPAVRSDSEVTLQLQTVQQADDLSASAFMLYTPSKKPNEHAKIDLFKNDIPHFFDRSVRLNLGMRHADGGDSPKLMLVNCEIQEINI